MAEIKQDLKFSEDLNQKLQQDLEISNKQQEKVKIYEAQILKLKQELSQTKDKVSSRDLKIQESKFNH